MSGSFRSSVWDPSLIISQILCVQASYYLSLGIWIVLLDLVVMTEQIETQLSLGQIYNFDSFQLKNGIGVLCAYMLNAITGGISLWYIVKRTKHCLDFTVTVHLIHFIVCCIYNSRMPSSVSWWITSIVVIVIMTVLGEFLCMRTEMKEIPLGTSGKVDL
ncbi:protein SYS1 homolog [Watersipora subatra]|uniref:protein SYS1 homolog n=1 Tax=Watersipora subatra TaxID=2589382 RepID=UPI00355C57E9